MTEDAPLYEINRTDTLSVTADAVVRLGNRSIILDLRRCFLDAVEQLERAAGVSPTTAEIRSMWRTEKLTRKCTAEGQTNGRS